MGPDMKTSDKMDDIHKEFMRLVHAIESNKKNYNRVKNTKGPPFDEELIIGNIIKYQEQLLAKLMFEMNLELTDQSRDKKL